MKIFSLNNISWIASIFSIAGVFLNAYKLIWCWPVWCIANILWIGYSMKTKQYAQVLLWIVFTLANIYAWYLWSQ